MPGFRVYVGFGSWVLILGLGWLLVLGLAMGLGWAGLGWKADERGDWRGLHKFTEHWKLITEDAVRVKFTHSLTILLMRVQGLKCCTLDPKPQTAMPGIGVGLQNNREHRNLP